MEDDHWKGSRLKVDVDCKRIRARRRGAATKSYCIRRSDKLKRASAGNEADGEKHLEVEAQIKLGSICDDFGAVRGSCELASACSSEPQAEVMEEASQENMQSEWHKLNRLTVKMSDKQEQKQKQLNSSNETGKSRGQIGANSERLINAKVSLNREFATIGRNGRSTLANRKQQLSTLALLLTAFVLGVLQLVQPTLSQQYKPEWPQKVIEQEIFLLNLEDGYFGCQVNASQDFLQLFELSRLCDGQTQCYLGSDELESQLKCRNRDRCELSSASASANSTLFSSGNAAEEHVRCVNGVCLDGLCYCNDGFGGKSCDIPDENECKFRPCDVFAHCTNTMGSYYCSCFPGYDGDGMRCQDINECEIPSLRALCSDNSECVNLPGHFVCKCKPGYQQSGLSQSSLTGAPIGNATVQCTDVDECSLAGTCGKGALCENLPGSFRCACPPGFSGDPTIECIDMDECRNGPCGIGAQCTNIPGGYRCSCAPGHERNPSAPLNLLGTVQVGDSSQQQQILEQMANNSLVACLDVNECLAPPGGRPVCGQGAQCVNTQGGYFCQCPPGFSGNPKVACLDIDECASHACGPNAQCTNVPGSFKCDCKPGYTGNAYLSDGCHDEDECLRKETCGMNAQCFNTLGGHQCTCLSGFTGDPYKKCLDVDECATESPCGQGAQCLNLEGGYKCSCPEKYLARGTPEMGCERAAVDIGCQGDFDCTKNAQCLNSTCQCKLGFQISGIECVDVDECSVTSSLGATSATATTSVTSAGFPTSSSTVKPFTRLSAAAAAAATNLVHANQTSLLCGPEANCQNLEGSYRCECKSGYEKLDRDSNTSKCHDVNECERSQPCGPNSKCFNTNGAFRCLCNDGFVPADQNPASGCKSPCDGVNCGPHASCKTHGEEAACVCKPGFTFDPNNITLGCVDINECDTNYGPSGLCGQRAICTNVPGSYRCHCPSGFAGDAYRYCEDINECDRKFGVFGQCGDLAVCTNKPGSFSCACESGYSGDPREKCTDVDECSTGKFKCALNAICVNTPGKYSCQCPPNHSGDPTLKCVPEQPPCASSGDCGPNQVCQAGRCSCPFATQSGESIGDCKHPCDRTECGEHATCQLDSDNQPLCVCDSGFMAPSDGRSGCVDVNECIQGVTLSGVTPISALNGGPAVALGPGGGTNATAGNGHPCGRNALCRNQPGSFDCICPAGYSGDAYSACNPDSRSQITTTTTTTTTTSNQQQQQLTSTTNSDSGEQFGNYAQEPRTSSCSEPCERGHICSDGKCVKRDSCRENQDCLNSQVCEHFNQALGFQCVNVCDGLLNQCGPNARCAPNNHKPICSCDASAGFAGNPYDLVNGCRQLQANYEPPLQTTTQAPATQQVAVTNSISNEPKSSPPATRYQDQLDQRRTTVSSQQQGDISTVSFDYGNGPTSPNSQQRQQQQVSTSKFTTTSSQSNVSTSNMNELMRQQVLEQHKQSSDKPNSSPALVAYEVPLPTTPNLPNFDPFGPTTTTKSKQQQASEQKADLEAQQVFEGQNRSSLSNKSPLISQQQQIAYKQMACTSDQHCPGNLFCLANQQENNNNNLFEPLLRVSDRHQKFCGCPSEYQRDGDLCFMQRLNCTSSAACRPREECVAQRGQQQQQLALGSISQQFALAGGEEFAQMTSGICICPRGYKLTPNGLNCVDRNECDEGTPCALGAICQNKVGSYECVCPPGTIGEPYTKTCEPISGDECQSNQDCASDRECDLSSRKCVSPCHVCGPRAICTAAKHAAICLCPPRYIGNAIDQVYGCQEPPPTTTTTNQQQTPTTTTMAPQSAPPAPSSLGPRAPLSSGSTSALGVPSTTLLPPLSSSKDIQTTSGGGGATTPNPSESTTVDLPEYRTIPPSELFVMCLADGIHVDLQLEKFDGIIYVKGHSQDPKCRKLVTSNGAPNQMVDFKVQFGHCDLIHRDGEAGFVLVIQKHPKLVTYRARAYHVKCVYNTGERTVTLGFNVSMITTSGTIANTGPPPTCLMSIAALDGREVTSAEIGQDLLLRVDVQPDSIYGGFARSCEAKTVDDEGEYQYEVTDANGCATDPSIFSDWKYDELRKSLVARFNAFKFPSSNNLRFQCNIRVCFGSCPPANCNGIDAYGKRRRRRAAPSLASGPNSTELMADEAAASGEPEELLVADVYKEGALREEIMVQSNAILTFDKKEEASLAQRRPANVEDIEFVCLPRLGIVMSIALTSLLGLLALAIASSCWCFAKRKRERRTAEAKGQSGPLPHPAHFQNPLMRSTISLCNSESIYGP